MKMWRNENTLTYCSGECKWCSCFGKQFGGYHKFKYKVSTRPRNLVYTQVNWRYVHAKTYTWCHSSTIYNSSKLLTKTFPKIDEWVNKSSISLKWNIIQPWEGKVLVCAITWMKFENNMLSEGNKTQIPHIIQLQLCEISEIDKFMLTESRLVLPRGEWKVIIINVWFLLRVMKVFSN